MVKAVSGFKTSDGRFFEDAEDADFHEALMIITELGNRSIQITQQNLPAFIDFITMHPQEIINLCDTYKALSRKVKEPTESILEEMQKGEEFDAPSKKPSTT